VKAAPIFCWIFLHACTWSSSLLIGDILDVWNMRQISTGPQLHNNVLRTLSARPARTRIIYVPGNHDDEFRDVDGTVFGNHGRHRDYVHHHPARPPHGSLPMATKFHSHLSAAVRRRFVSGCMENRPPSGPPPPDRA